MSFSLILKRKIAFLMLFSAAAICFLTAPITIAQTLTENGTAKYRGD